MAISRLTIVKFVELALAIAILVIHYQTIEEPVPFNSLVATGTYAGFAIIVVGTFLGFMTGNSINKSVDLFFCVAGAILYILSAWFTYNHFSGWKFNTGHANLGITKSVLALIQGIVFIVDGFFTFKIE
uniref:DUF7775 domain-containing protein n=1 Tax=Graphocephala atropunctata TaxID=36148 RepID=A0A1B6L227_9HEMI